MKSQCGTVSAYLEACTIDKRHLAYVFLSINDKKFLNFAAWLRETLAPALVQMHGILASVESAWDLNLARLDSTVTIGYFAARKAEVRLREYSVLEEFVDVCDFLTFLLES